jgi:hypothetical protein
MKSRPLIITKQTDQDIARMKEWAMRKDNIITLERLKAMMKEEGPMGQPIGDDPRHKMVIPLGYMVVYSVEEQPMGLTHHISISVAPDSDPKNTEPMPNVYALDVILNAFGLPGHDKAMITWLEDFGAGTTKAVNLVYPMEAK